MRRKDKISLVIFLMIVIALILIVTLNIEFFYNLIDKYVEIYGYPAVFVFSFLADVIDQPIGPEVPASIGTLLGLDPLFVFLLAVAGSWIISLINFNIGRNYLSEKIQKSCKTRSYINYCRLFHKYGEIALLLATLTPVPYVFFVWLSGSFRMRLRNFFVFGLLARAFRIGFILLTARTIFLGF